MANIAVRQRSQWDVPERRRLDDQSGRGVVGEAGTEDDYPGPYWAAREFKAPTTAELAAVKEFARDCQIHVTCGGDGGD